MSENYDTLRQAALKALEEQNPQEAFAVFRRVLEYPGAQELDHPSRWQEAWELFAKIATPIAGEAFAQVVRRAAQDERNVQALYDLGYQLVEQSLHGLAATVLLRAHLLVPGAEPMVSELVVALEGMGAHAEAARLLQAQPHLVQTSFLCRYLLAYNAMMSGDLDEPRRLAGGLEMLLVRSGAEGDEAVALASMKERIHQMLARADALKGVSPLDKKDLRGWHFVTTGGVLLHLSPYGFNEGMTGRYAFLQDSEARCLEGIRRVEAVLAQAGRKPPRVFVLPDRESAILAHATARVLSMPTEPWPEQGSDAPGLIVAYDLSQLDGPLLQTLTPHRPGQVLWSHATPWTEEAPFAADLTTFLYQHNTSPWGERLRVNPETQKTERTAPAEGPVETLAAAVVSARLEDGALEDVPTLKKLVGAMATVAGEAAGGLFLEQGRRRRNLKDSPVKSSRFA
ncbi:MAG TPA: hypothetical protein VK358_17125 [Longimicrobium sp.]|jgi:hypothetical protein|nr:hypothetical protein [Longimicrobium sp.]